MKNLLLFVALIATTSLSFSQAKIKVEYEGITINNTSQGQADPSAVLDVNSLNKGVLFPRLSTVQRDQINPPAMGLLIFNTTTKAYQYFDGTDWKEFPFILANTPTLPSVNITTNWNDNSAADGEFWLDGPAGTSNYEWHLPDGSIVDASVVPNGDLIIPANSGVLDGTDKVIKLVTTTAEFQNMVNIIWTAKKIKGTLDLSAFEGATLDAVRISSNSIDNIVFPQMTIDAFLMYIDNNNLTNLDLSNVTLTLDRLYAQGNPITSATFKPGTIINAGPFRFQGCNITGTFDLSNITFNNSAIEIESNPNMTGVIFGSGQYNFTRLWARNSNLGYVDITEADLDQDNMVIHLQNNSMTSAVVNHILHDINLSSTSIGTGRLLAIHQQASPDSSSGGFDGITAKSELESKGWSVTTNP